MKIATLISVYIEDDAVALARALDSVLDQELSDEVESHLYLVIDGPVHADIDRIISDREDRIYHIQRLEHNHGLAAALNSIIKILGDEEFVFRMDADDYSHLNRYQTQLDYFKIHSSIDILGTDIIEVEVGNAAKRRVRFCSGPDDALAKLCQRVPVAHPTVCFRRHVLDRVGGYPLVGTNEDIALWFHCAQEGFMFDNVSQPLLDFTVNHDFWQRRSVDKAFSELRCYMTGIWRFHGVTWKYIFPILRFTLRVSPLWLSRYFYNSSIRTRS